MEVRSSRSLLETPKQTLFQRPNTPTCPLHIRPIEPRTELPLSATAMEPTQPEIPALTDLIAALDNATQMAKHLPPEPTTDPSQLHQLFSSFQTAHHHLTSIISRLQSSSQRQLIENSVSSAVGDQEVKDEPMEIGEEKETNNNNNQEEETEENSNARLFIDRVEESLRNCVIQNKRRKRPLSPTSAVVEQRPMDENGVSSHGVSGFDPLATRLQSLDLVFQFHG